MEANFDIYIITWNKFQESKIYDYSANGCVYKILQGCVNESIYDTNTMEKISEKCLKKDDSSCISNGI